LMRLLMQCQNCLWSKQQQQHQCQQLPSADAKSISSSSVQRSSSNLSKVLSVQRIGHSHWHCPKSCHWTKQQCQYQQLPNAHAAAATDVQPGLGSALLLLHQRRWLKGWVCVYTSSHVRPPQVECSSRPLAAAV
jgi:hypothetical protein